MWNIEEEKKTQAHITTTIISSQHNVSLSVLHYIWFPLLFHTQQRHRRAPLCEWTNEWLRLCVWIFSHTQRNREASSKKQQQQQAAPPQRAQYQFSFVGSVDRAYFEAIGTNENVTHSWTAFHFVIDHWWLYC